MALSRSEIVASNDSMRASLPISHPSRSATIWESFRVRPHIVIRARPVRLTFPPSPTGITKHTPPRPIGSTALASRPPSRSMKRRLDLFAQ
jgi:hypothetical protein